MGRLNIELSLIPVDAGAKAESKIAWLTIKNQQAIKILEWSMTTLGGRVKLEINTEANEHARKLMAYPPYASSFLFGVSLSMANPNILFSPLFWDFLNSSVDEGVDGGKEPIPKAYKTVKIDFENIAVEVDETKVLDVLSKLFDYKYSGQMPNTPFKKNIKESINNYQLALISPNIHQRFTFLYFAFEKAVNTGGKNRRDNDFDEEASELTKIEKAKIKDVRTFYDRMKHPFRKAEDILTLESGIKNFSQLALDLKTATDNAILARISNTKP